MRLIRSFGLIGVGAFAAGIFYSRARLEDGSGNWLLVAVSLAIAVGGLIDLIAHGWKKRRRPLSLEASQ
jgi:hypothetical protein